MRWVRVLNEMRRLYLSPHPSREGRGSFPCGCVWLAANRGGEGEGIGGCGMGGRRTNINRKQTMTYSPALDVLPLSRLNPSRGVFMSSPHRLRGGGAQSGGMGKCLVTPGPLLHRSHPAE
jgi:hypothetical protein